MKRCHRVCGGLLAILALSLAVPGALGQDAVNLVKNGDAESGNLDNWTGFSKVVSEGAHGGQFSFSRTGAATVVSNEYIPIDVDKTYELTGWAKSVGEGGKSKFYLGFIPYDEKKRAILPQYVSTVPGTETALVEACAKTDTVIKVADGAKWKKLAHGYIAFEADGSGQYADLPNSNLSSINIVNVENKGDHWELTLKKPCGRAYAAGTIVREQLSGSTYLYAAAGGKAVPTEWTLYKGKVAGEALNTNPMTRWRRGTKYARIMMLVNYQQKAEFQLLLDDIGMMEVAPKPAP